MAVATDLFAWIEGLYSKKAPDGTPPTYMIHRFLASDKLLAPFARELQLHVREPDLVYRTWQGLLPGGHAPRFGYIAAKKGPAAEDLTLRMMKVLGERRSVCEQMQEIVQASGRLKELYRHFGVEAPDDPAPTPTKRGKKAPAAKPKTGLLAD